MLPFFPFHLFLLCGSCLRFFHYPLLVYYFQHYFSPPFLPPSSSPVLFPLILTGLWYVHILLSIYFTHPSILFSLSIHLPVILFPPSLSFSQSPTYNLLHMLFPPSSPSSPPPLTPSRKFFSAVSASHRLVRAQNGSVTAQRNHNSPAAS